jgi:hypothetical protein
MGATQRKSTSFTADQEAFEFGALHATQFLRRTRADQSQAVALDVARGFIVAAAGILAHDTSAASAARFLLATIDTIENRQ